MVSGSRCDQWSAIAALYWLTINALIVIVGVPCDDEIRPGTSFSSRDRFCIYRSIAAIPCRFRPPPVRHIRRRYPLVVFLHGAGERGTDNSKQLKGLPEQLNEYEWRQRFPCYVVVPQCSEGRNWNDLRVEVICLIDDIVNKYPIDKERIYLTGLSMGGHGCWVLAAAKPHLFAALVPICGYGNPWGLSTLLSTPIWCFHGDADRVVPVEESRQMVLGLRKLGSAEVVYTELPGVGHDCWSRIYRDPQGAIPWLFNQHQKLSK